MAEFVMKYLVEQEQLTDQYLIESAATSTEEIGNPVYPPARRKLAEHGISCQGHAARQMTRADYNRYDLLVGMDSTNIRNMTRICGGSDPDGKIVKSTLYHTPTVATVATCPTHGIRATSKPHGKTY